MDKSTLTTEEAATRLGITATRVRAMIAAGQLPAERFGPVYVIQASDLRLVEGRKTGRPPKPKVEATNGQPKVARKSVAKKGSKR
jgi:excisionase family DNA binding protein